MFREADEDESGFMCCAFSARERFLMLGTCTGQLKLYNVFTGQEEASYSCHSSAITHLEPSRVSRRSMIDYVVLFASLDGFIVTAKELCALGCSDIHLMGETSFSLFAVEFFSSFGERSLIDLFIYLYLL